MKKLCKVIAIALLCITITTPVINTSFAMETSEVKKVNEMLESEGFEQIDLSQIPEGVTPIVVNSEEELQKAIENVENEISEINKPVFVENEISEMNKPVLSDFESYNDTNLLLRSARSTKSARYKNFHVTKKISLTTHNLFGTLKIIGKNIKSVHNLKQDWTGYQLGTDYQNHPAKNISYTLVNNKQTAKIIAPYKVGLYIFFEGIGHIASKYGSTTFYVKK